MFAIRTIDDALFQKMYGRSFKADCTVPRSDLRHLSLEHRDIDGNAHAGELVCHRAIAEDVLAIFKALFEARYPIEKVRLIDEYDADDMRSMADNNCSSFNFRLISHTSQLSKHAKGLAVDINPFYNPYMFKADGRVIIQPDNTEAYVDRSRNFPYKLNEGDLCWRLFKERGFAWGGDWTLSKDWQHFELPDAAIERLGLPY